MNIPAATGQCQELTSKRELRAWEYNERATHSITSLPQTGSCRAMNPPRLAQEISQPPAQLSPPTLEGASVKPEGGTWAVRTSPFLIPQHQPSSATVLAFPAPSSCHKSAILCPGEEGLSRP